ADEIAINEDVNTRKGVERILRAAFVAARGRRKRVCMSDKANALTYAHGLWQRTFAELKREYADVEASHLYVDVAAMEMVRAPDRAPPSPPAPAATVTPAAPVAKKEPPPVYTVSDLVRAAARTIEGRFGMVSVEGEISNFSAPRSGHLYFTLKDAEAQLPSV